MSITELSNYNYYLSKYWELIDGKWFERGKLNPKATPPNNIIMEYLKYILSKSEGEVYG